MNFTPVTEDNMGAMDKSPVRLFILSLMVLSTSCATRVADFKMSPDFTGKAITTSGIIIGGYAAPKIDLKKVMTAIRDSHSGKSAEYGDLIDLNRAAINSKILEEAIRGKRAGYPITGGGILVKRLGKKKYQEFTSQYFLTGAPDEKWLKEIRKLKIRGRYLLMACEKKRNVKYVTHKRKIRKNEESVKKRYQGGSELTLEVIRTMDVLFTIHDLNSGLEVWHGKIKKSKSRTSRQKAYIGSSGVGIRLKSGNLLGKRKPDTPREIDVLKDIFEAFAQSLPE